MEEPDIEEVSLIINNLTDYALIYKKLLNSDSKGKWALIDLSDHESIEPIHIILLSVTLIQFNNSDYNGFVNPPKYQQNVDILKDIRFFDFLKSNSISSYTVSQNHDSNAIPVRRLNTENMDSYIMEMVEFYEKKCKGKDTSMLNICIAELINNVYDHAAKEEYSEIQAYIFSLYIPETNKISISVADYGVGIPEKANSYFLTNNSAARTDEECIKWALELNESSHSKPHNRGKGLNNIYSFVKASGSSLKILSNNAMMQCIDGDDIFTKNPISHFKGTMVEIQINIDGLDDRYEDLVDTFWL